MPTDDIVVNPISETAEPVEQEQVTPPSPQPEAEAPTADPPAAEPVEGDSQETPKPEAQPKADTPPKPEKSHREKLIDQLTGVEEPQPEDEDEEPTPPANKQDPASPPKPEGDPKDKPEEVPEDLNELTNDTAKAMKPGEVRRKINRLIKRVKDAEPYAQGYKEIVEACEANGFSPDDYKAWVGIGIGLQKGNPKAAELLKQVAAKAGIPLEAPPAAGPPPELEKVLAELEESVDVSPAAARKLRALFAPTSAKPASPPTPAPAAPAPAPAAPAPHPNHPSPEQLRVDAGLREMTTVGERWKEKLGAARWTEIQPKLAAALKAKGQRPPESWASIYEAEIEKLVATAKPAAAPSPSLRPGGKAGSPTPQFKTERERTIHRITNGG